MVVSPAEVTFAPPFPNTHQALVFAFGYTQHEFPSSSSLYRICVPSAGAGRGLQGMDGAAQAGMILCEVDLLTLHQRAALTVRYGGNEQECRACGQMTTDERWNDAIDALTHFVELEGLPRRIRHLFVKSSFGLGRIDTMRMTRDFSLSKRTLFRQLAELKKRLRKIESEAHHAIDAVLREKLVVEG